MSKVSVVSLFKNTLSSHTHAHSLSISLFNFDVIYSSEENVKEQYCQCSTVCIISAYRVIVPLLQRAGLMMYVFINWFSIIVLEEAGLLL